jgi:hypothetical protein
MDDMVSISAEEYRALRRQLRDAATDLLVQNDPKATRSALELIGLLKSRCVECAAELDVSSEGTCPQCGTLQPWVVN